MIKIKEYIKHNVDKVFLVILILSLIFIFFNFIIGKNCYIYNDVGTDTVHQYYPYYINEVLNIRQGNFSVWNFSYGLGTSSFDAQDWTLDIFGLLLVSIGSIVGVNKVQYLLVYMQIIKIIIIYILTKKFLSYYLKDRVSICLAAYLGAMNGFVFLWGQHYWFGTACVYMLLILCCMESFLKQVTKRNFICLSLTIASLLMYGFYVGYMILIPAALFFILKLIYIEGTFKEKLEKFVKCAYSVIIGIFISGIIFIPSCYNIFTASDRLSNVNDSILIRVSKSFFESFRIEYIIDSMLRTMSNNLTGSSWVESYYELPQFFCTIFMFFFVIQFFIYDFKNCKTRKECVFCILKIFTLYLLVFNDLSALFFNAFVEPSYRYTFILIPFFALIVGLVWEKIIKTNNINFWGIIIYIFTNLFIFVYCYCDINYEKIFNVNFYIQKTSFYINNDFYLYILLSFLIIGSIFILLIYFRKKEKNICKIIFIVIIILSSCFENYETTNNRGIVNNKEIISLELDNLGLENDTGKALKWLKENDKSFYRVESTYEDFYKFGESFIRNESSVTCYNSTMNPYLKEFYTKIYPESIYNEDINVFYINNDKDNTNTMQAIYITNSKYILSKKSLNIEGLELINTFGDVNIYRNINTEQIAKFFTKTITDDQYLNRDKSNKLLFETAINDNNLMLDENAEAQVGEFTLQKQTYLTGEVTCTGKGLLMLGVPYQEGWKVYVDGKKVDKTYRVDYGFIGVELEEGEHKIELKYNLPKLEIGALFTIIGLINLIVLILIKKNKYFEEKKYE